MPRKLRKPGALGLALTAYEVWRKLPPEHRRAIITQARKHGPKVARAVAARTPKRTR
jgi:hypothetical protein